MARLEGFVEKGWGHELIWATNDKYCGKLMKFNQGARFSMHFHSEKDETWYVWDGEYTVKYIDTKDASEKQIKLTGPASHLRQLRSKTRRSKFARHVATEFATWVQHCFLDAEQWNEIKDACASHTQRS